MAELRQRVCTSRSLFGGFLALICDIESGYRCEESPIPGIQLLAIPAPETCISTLSIH